MFFSRRAGHKFIDRGDPDSPDWETGAFTTDNTWRDLDCSSIVPANAKAIVFAGYITDDAVNSQFMMRKKGCTNLYTIRYVVSQVINKTMAFSWLMACDNNRVVQYKATAVTFSYIQLNVIGWFV